MSYEETLYARYLNEELTTEEIEKLKHSGEWDELERIKNVSDSLSLPAMDLEQGFNQLKENRTSAKVGNTKTRNLKPWYLVAASFLVLVSCYFLFLPENGNTLTVALGSSESTTLADNTMVTLNDGSSIKYNVKDNVTDRTIELKGEAYFDVMRPGVFDVHTKNGSVHVLGTQFSVRAWEDNLVVVCYEGEVLVKRNGSDVKLKANQGVRMFSDGQNQSLEISNGKPNWMQGSSRFYIEELNSVFNELERQYAVKIKRPEFIRKFNGAFDHNSLEGALEQICQPMNLEFEISEDRKTVTVKQ